MKPLDAIREEPLTQLRATLHAHADTESFTPQDFRQFAAMLEQDADSASFAEEIQTVDRALRTGHAAMPRLDTPHKQLLWAAAFRFLLLNPQWMGQWSAERRAEMIEALPLWQDIVNSPDAQRELARHRQLLAQAGDAPDIALAWGAPGSGFRYDASERSITLDPFRSLAIGFEHARALALRTIGRSRLEGDTLPPRMEALRDKRAPLLEKKDSKEGLSEAEEIYLRGLTTEWKTWKALLKRIEDGAANRYAADRSDDSAQDYRVSLNATLVTSGDIERAIRFVGGDPATGNYPVAPDASQQFENIKNALRMAFYQRNGLFEDTPEGWHRVGVVPEWICARHPFEPGRMLPWTQSFRQLLEYARRAEALQPPIDPSLPYNAERAAEYAAQRNALFEEIWERFAGPIVEIAEEPPQEKSEEKGEGEGEGEGSGEGEGEGEGESKQGSSSGGKGGAGGAGSSAGNGSSAGGNPSGKDDAPQDSDALSDGVGDEKETAGDNESAQDQDGAEAGEQDAAAPDECSIEEAEGPSMKDAPDGGGPGQAEDGSSEKAGALSEGGGVSEQERAFVPGDWCDYEQACRLNRQGIKRVAARLRAIQERQLQLVDRRSPELTVIPEQFDLGLLDFDAHVDLAVREQFGPIDPRHKRRWVAERPQAVPVPVTFIAALDGSGSGRKLVGESKRRRIDASTDATCLLHEGCKQAGIDSYIVEWGDVHPQLIAKPGDHPRKTGAAIAGVKKCVEEGRTGTSLAPLLRSIPAMLQKSRRHAPDDMVGQIHIQLISDGDIQDPQEAEAALHDLLASKHVTLDVVLVGRDESKLEAVIARVNAHPDRRPYQRIGVAQGGAEYPEQVATGMIGMLGERLSKTRIAMGVPHAERERGMARLARQMQPQERAV